MEEFTAGEDRPLIPEGKYSAQCIEARDSKVSVGTAKGTYSMTSKVILIFRITDGERQGQDIRMFLNSNYKRIPPGSKFYRAWVIANDSLKPKRKGRMSLAVFRNHVFTVGVKTVKPKFGDGTDMPEAFWYSRVDEVYEKLA